MVAAKLAMIYGLVTGKLPHLIHAKQTQRRGRELRCLHSSSTQSCSDASCNRVEWSVGVKVESIVFAVLLTLGLAACGETDTVSYSAEQLQQWRQDAETHAGGTAALLAQDPEAMALAENLFAAHCASCHGGDARGKLRVPDLVQGALDYGDSEDAVRITIREGRHSAMPRLGRVLGEFELGVMAAYVKSLSGGEPLDTLYTDTALELYAEHCVACHGADAKGNPALGASDLTDDSWQFASAVNGVRMTMTGGTDSICPPQGALLSTAEIELLTGYVLKLRAAN